MAKDVLSWNDVKKYYLEFHQMDEFTENMAIDIDFGYWLVNNCIIPDVIKSVCPACKKEGYKPNTFYCPHCGYTAVKQTVL